MTLYHGTNCSFSEIDLAKGLPAKDFGRGFYTTDSFACAERTARQRVTRLGGEARIMVYDIADSAFDSLSVKRFSAPCKEWALFVRANRRTDVDSVDHNRDNRYDVVIGPVANDKLSLLFRLYDRDLITVDDFVSRMQFKELYMQFSFHCATAVAQLNLKEIVNVA